MKQILILGGTGKLGQLVIQKFLDRKYHVVALVRNPQKFTIDHALLTVIKGDVTDEKDLSRALKNCDSVVSTLGHGLRTSFPIQEKAMSKLIPLMEKGQCKRLIAVTGAALPVAADPASVMVTLTEKLLTLIDPYRMNDARRQQELLEKSTLEWTVVRTPVQRNGSDTHIRNIGYKQPAPWDTLSRSAIAKFIITCLEEEKWIKESPIIF